MKKEKERLDVALVRRGHCESRQKAQRVIMARQVRLGETVPDKPGMLVACDAPLEVVGGDRYVGRGGLKLERALDHFRIDPTGMVCLDIGASTGGFTDCLLQRGARRVYAVDSGHGQLHWRIRKHPGVVVMEKCNARHLDRPLIPESPGLLVMDVSFISMTLILPAVVPLLQPGARSLLLVKPQFELQRHEVGRGGVVRDPALHRKAVERIRAFMESEIGGTWNGVVDSPITGADGNREFLACHTKRSESSPTPESPVPRS